MNNANEKNVKTNNKPVAKVIAIVLAFALMIATSFCCFYDCAQSQFGAIGFKGEKRTIGLRACS